MNFFEHFTPQDRERLLAVSRPLRLQPGTYLIRRGERGGDIFQVESGSFDVVDTRAQPEVVLDSVGAGDLVGEMSFLDMSPRGADVRAVGPCVVRKWERGALIRLLGEDAALGSVFYEALARMAVERMRGLSAKAMVGGLGATATQGGPRVGAALAREAEEVVGKARGALAEAEADLRRNADDEAAAAAVHTVVAALVDDVAAHLGEIRDPIARAGAGASLRSQLLPYLVRSRIGTLAQDLPTQQSDAALRSHVLAARPSGEGSFGERLDAALLDIPLAHALRARALRVVRAVEAACPRDRAARILLLGPGHGELLTDLAGALPHPGAHLTCVETRREELEAIHQRAGKLWAADGPDTAPGDGRLRLVQDDLASLAAGRTPLRYGRFDLIVAEGLAERLPARLSASLMGWSADHLEPGGSLVVSALGPGSDDMFVDHVLGWPLLRRTAVEIASLLAAAGLPVRDSVGDDEALVVVGVARR